MTSRSEPLVVFRELAKALQKDGNSVDDIIDTAFCLATNAAIQVHAIPAVSASLRDMPEMVASKDTDAPPTAR